MDIRLDLLPEGKREELRYERLFGRILFWSLAFLVSAIILLATLYGISLVVSLNAGSSTAERLSRTDQERYAQVEEYEKAFADTSRQLDDLNAIAADQLYWSRILAKLSELVPDGITVSGFSTQDYAANLTGTAGSRDILAAFKDALSGDGCFDDVNLPLSDLVEKDDIDFQMTFSVKEECLKNR